MNRLPIVPSGLSDLFFNHSHDHYDLLYASHRHAKTAPTDEEVRAAVLEDAREFCTCLFIAYGVTEDPAALVDDFMKRV